MVIDALSHLNEVISYDDEVSMSQKNASVGGKAHSKRWTKLFSVSRWLSVFKYVKLGKI